MQIWRRPHRPQPKLSLRALENGGTTKAMAVVMQCPRTCAFANSRPRCRRPAERSLTLLSGDLPEWHMLCLLAGQLWHQRCHAWTLPGGSSQEPSQGKGPPPQTRVGPTLCGSGRARSLTSVAGSRIRSPRDPIGSLCLASDIVTVRTR